MEKRNTDFCNAMCEAARNGEITKVKKLFESNPECDVNKKDDNGWGISFVFAWDV